jgi:hypothetical protein
MHSPPTHSRLPLQLLPQAPQLSASLRVFTQVPPHEVRPPGQLEPAV